jgi:hypothetical protein
MPPFSERAFSVAPPPVSLHRQASTCQIERREINEEARKLDILAVLANVGGRLE